MDIRSIVHIFADMETVIETIRRLSAGIGATGVVPMATFFNERKRLENEELSSLKASGDILPRKLVNGYGIELIKK